MDATTRHFVLRERFFRRDRRSVPAARKFTHWALVDWDLTEGFPADDVLLCVSELCTNALLHGVPPGRGFRLNLRYDGDVLRIEVHDSGPGVPQIVDSADGEGGRGLLLVAAFADKWGVGERNPGKVVWCEFEVRRQESDEATPPAVTHHAEGWLGLLLARP
ncbi:ATP-binding protein [Streptomyces scopuliridis]|uniref:ATP-binding protein n=1 Tax=Streptomyces scopuliridis TaxID=452529 RepID=UPI002DD97657|nr:ATP-binding protein [Streptomyces scopuliridis]WSB34251.1 ATP-binding protein [Streptomyces scopuliridis]